MPEQLALELALRDVRAIHRQVDLVRPRPGRLDVSRDHVLAYPRLAENQDRRGRCRGLARARQEVLHERAFADWRREPVAAADFPAERPHFPPQSPQLESATHAGRELPRVHGLADVVDRARASGLESLHDRAASRDEQDRGRVRHGPAGLEHLRPFGSFHRKLAHDEVERGNGVRPEKILGAFENFRRVPGAGEHPRQRGPQIRVVFNQGKTHHRPPTESQFFGRTL